MNDSTNRFDQLLEKNGPVAIIIKQYLRPDVGEGEPIFPPTYLMPTFNGRVHTIRDGEYRVSVELPAFRQDGKKEDKSQDAAGYNIDTFSDGLNICEIDSPQSQANRIEPLFETIKGGKLVPQIKIKVGNQPEPVNLLRAGHRAADAVVRFSSLVQKFSDAFTQVCRGNHYDLARLAPTSILFGVWDSRGTQVKLQRIMKAEIRATNVRPLTKSAVFNPAAPFVEAQAVEESHSLDTLSEEGMKHALASRTVGGVEVKGEIRRTVRINLIALRDLRAYKSGTLDPKLTNQLQRYVLGLALVAASQPLQLNLREGCLLCRDKGKPGSSRTVKQDGSEEDFPIDSSQAEEFAEAAAKGFFGDDYDKKDIPDAQFESGVANEYLAMSKEYREKVARSGPITAEAIRRVKEKGKDPLKPVVEALKEAKKSLPKKPRGKASAPFVQKDAFKAVLESLTQLEKDEENDQSLKDLAGTLRQTITGDVDSHATMKALDDKIKEFNRQRKAGAPVPETEGASVSETDIP